MVQRDVPQYAIGTQAPELPTRFPEPCRPEKSAHEERGHWVPQTDLGLIRVTRVHLDRLSLFHV
jgi:hypothetical protein